MSLTGSREYSIVITDTSCFITLDKIGAFDVLRKAFSHIATTPEIQEEFGSELPEWIEIRPVQDHTLKEVFKETVDAGEASIRATCIKENKS
ncbi:hypothetical protein GCM10007415_34420 [Parapedobacter pyrenivorans]|uniref:Uncharacterized protein n=1 Tax=Parapedobacter pyrenivorans TaxID=1305674 RepID=A0A917MFD5_9SPHI|nr:hypothetical protein [Parapedobacter pyrenivorans]GGG96334.1 hypothetical protein GCM10007415_34420 [Parapedobacter pyrenivorans]